MGLGQRTDDCPVFYPTLKDMEGGWESYIVGIEKRFARAGICKIIPPAGWKARKGGYDDMDGSNLTIPKAIKQSASGRVSSCADSSSIRAAAYAGHALGRSLHMSRSCAAWSSTGQPSRLQPAQHAAEVVLQPHNADHESNACST